MSDLKLRLLAFTAFIICISSCGKRKNKAIDLSHIQTRGVTLKVDSGTTKVEIKEGKIAGTSVQFASGTVAVGTTVQIQQANQPQIFSSINIPEASSPIAVSATNDSGQAVTSLGNLMTITIPIQSAGLTANNYESLCILL